MLQRLAKLALLESLHSERFDYSMTRDRFLSNVQHILGAFLGRVRDSPKPSTKPHGERVDHGANHDYCKRQPPVEHEDQKQQREKSQTFTQQVREQCRYRDLDSFGVADYVGGQRIGRMFGEELA